MATVQIAKWSVAIKGGQWVFLTVNSRDFKLRARICELIEVTVASSSAMMLSTDSLNPFLNIYLQCTLAM